MGHCYGNFVRRNTQTATERVVSNVCFFMDPESRILARKETPKVVESELSNVPYEVKAIVACR